MKSSRLLTIFIIVFVDLLGFSLILPLMPYYAEEYGASPFIVGLLVASYAAASLFGSPLLGRLSDRYGRRPVLLISVFGTLVGFLLLGLAVPIGEGLASLIAPSVSNAFVLGVLFLARILDGLTAGNLTVAQAYISDVTDEKNRAKGLGLIGAAFGLGFIIGPAVGGLLSKTSYSLPAFVAAAIAAINLLQIFFLLPETLTPKHREEIGESKRPAFSLQALAVALKRPVVGPLLHVRFFFGLAFATFQSIFALYAQYKLALSPASTGYILAYVGVLSVITQGGLIGPLTKRFRENQLIITGLWLMALSLLAWAFVPNLWVLLIVMLPLALAGGILGTVLQSAITKAVEPNEIGGMLGISGSLEAITRVIAPTVGGYLIGNLGTWAPGIFSTILMTWAIWFAYRRILKVKKNSTPAELEKILKNRIPGWLRITLVLFAALNVLIIGFLIWSFNPTKPMPEVFNLVSGITDSDTNNKTWLIFVPDGDPPETGFILYPGGHVDYRAYAPTAQEIADQGYQVIIVPMPLNLAVFNPGAANDVISTFPEIKHWAVGGHSLGGAMAANFVYSHPGVVDGLVLWAAYPPESNDLSTSEIKVLSVTGSLDGLSTPEKIQSSFTLLPGDMTWVLIQGGNHAQFGWYGNQSGDNPASISRHDQQEQIVQATAEFLEGIR